MPYEQALAIISRENGVNRYEAENIYESVVLGGDVGLPFADEEK